MKYPKKRVMFYIDGFNLYYGALRGKPYRWLDLEALCGQYIKPGAELVGIKYFTAKVKDRPDNPGQQAHQWEYLRALKTLPKVRDHLRALSHPESDSPAYESAQAAKEG